MKVIELQDKTENSGDQKYTITAFIENARLYNSLQQEINELRDKQKELLEQVLPSKGIKGHKQSKTTREQLSKKLMEGSQERERKRIAADLHDSLAQNLMVINNEVQRVMKRPNGKCRNLDSLKLAASIAVQSINEIEEIIYDLYPPLLDQLGLEKTIRWLVKRVSGTSEISIYEKIDIDGEAISPEMAINIYRIIQEGLSNVVKHSRASRCMIDLKGTKTDIDLRLEDNGKGFRNSIREGGNAGYKGFGLHGMAERAKRIGGSIKIDSKIGKGTALKLTVPIK